MKPPRRLLVLCVLIISIALTGCTNESIVEVDIDEGITVDTQEQEVAQEEEAISIFDAKGYQIEADSVLVDSTNIGFNYEAAMVDDEDFSTAWCSSEGGIGGKISYVFDSLVEASYFGVVGGFARDESIFAQNNRLKTIKIYLDDIEFGEYELLDEYGMQFVDLVGAQPFKKITMEIVAVYPGNKYDDTCIAEWDFWSDYVVNHDSVAAVNYYENYKQADALKPYDIVGSITVSDTPPAACKEPEPVSDMVLEENGETLYPSYSTLYFTSYINEYGQADQNLDVELYYKGYDDEWHMVDSAFEWPVVESCSGQLYQHIKVNVGWNKAYMIKIYNSGKLVGSKEIMTY